MIAPQGLTVTGVTTWIAQTAHGFVKRRHPVGVLVHGGLRGHHELGVDLPPGAELIRFNAPDVETLAGDLSPLVPGYRSAVARMAAGRSGGPVVLVPSRHGDCFGACAELCRQAPDSVRVLGLQHVASAYEDAIFARYEPMSAELAAVSAHIASDLRRRHPGRSVTELPNGVTIPDDLPSRKPLAGRPLRILYTGRIEHDQKRVGALLAMSDHLNSSAVEHELELLGDGPASNEIDTACAARPAVRRQPPVPPAQVAAHLAWADVLVLASRTEGLSISLLEAMAAGCVPVLTATPSGAGEAVADGESGILVPFDEHDDDAQVGRAMAEGIRRALDAGLDLLAVGARARVADRFDVERRIDRTVELVQAAARAPARGWPADVPCAFSGDGSGPSGSVPPDGPDRLAAVLNELAGRKVVVHGTGQHTLQLAAVLDAAPAGIIAFADDNPASHGGMCLDLPIVAPADAASRGATDVVLSSWMHEDAIWARRVVYERQGLRVHRLYGDSGHGNE